jgi:hypothetical protein
MNSPSPWLFETPLLLTNQRKFKPALENEWLFEAPIPIAPRLLTSESTPPFSTLYVDVNIGCSWSKVCPQPMTGIFFSDRFRFTPQVDLILYLQGHHRDRAQPKSPSPGYYPSNLTINQYWNQKYYPFFAFREGINASGKNVVLVAPTLGPRSEAGNLIKSNGFDAYIDQVLAAIRRYYAPSMMFEQPLSLGNLILACHSGGGFPMRQIALSGASYAAKIRECWGFDCTYNTGDDKDWARWAKMNPSSNVYIYYIANSQTAPLATSLYNLAKRQKLSNVFVGKSSTGSHNKVPITYWENRIKAASFLKNRTEVMP